LAGVIELGQRTNARQTFCQSLQTCVLLQNIYASLYTLTHPLSYCLHWQILFLLWALEFGYELIPSQVSDLQMKLFVDPVRALLLGVMHVLKTNHFNQSTDSL
jgi:hypothetical protein